MREATAVIRNAHVHCASASGQARSAASGGRDLDTVLADAPNVL